MNLHKLARDFDKMTLKVATDVDDELYGMADASHWGDDEESPPTLRSPISGDMAPFDELLSKASNSIRAAVSSTPDFARTIQGKKTATVLEALVHLLNPNRKAASSLKDRIIEKLSQTMPVQNVVSTGVPQIDPYTQKALKALVNPQLATDGQMNAATAEAIKAFRRQRNIPGDISFGDVQKAIITEFQTGNPVKWTTPLTVSAPKSGFPVAAPHSTLNNDVSALNRDTPKIDGPSVL